MKVSELAKDVGSLRTEVGGLRTEVGDLRTDVGDLRTDVGDLRTEVGDLRTEVGDLRTDVDKRFERVGREFEELRQLIKSEGETTRRHFDVVAEKMVSERNLALDRSMATAQQLAGLTATNAGDHVSFDRRLTDHDRRLDELEKGEPRPGPAAP